MDMGKIKAVEELVEEIADCYDEPDDETVAKFNNVTGNDWDAQTYFEYCCEYYSHHSLEQTVYALLNDGSYPDDTKVLVCAWKEKSPVNLQENDIYMSFRLGKEKKINNKFELLPISEILDWFKANFANWKLDERDEKFVAAEDGLSQISFNRIEKVAYGTEQRISFASYNKRFMRVEFLNVDDGEQKRLIEHLQQIGLHIYLPDN